jgi:hypothetical protein
MVKVFVLTRIAVRGIGRPSTRPLQEERLEFRFRIFEAVTAPSMAAQLGDGIFWFLITDPLLPSAYRARLDKIRRDLSGVHLVTCHNVQALRRAEWLRRYCVGNHDCIVTTNVDDDDALPDHYLQTLRQYVLGLVVAGLREPYFVVLGTSRIIQWDMLSTPDAPFGVASPWRPSRDGYPLVTSCGYSLFCQSPPYNLSVYSLPPHSNAGHVFRHQCTHVECIALRRRLKGVAEQYRLAPPSRPVFADLGPIVGPALVTNHRFNEQTRRISSPKRDPRAVLGPNGFPGLTIAWEKLAAEPSFFRPL